MICYENSGRGQKPSLLKLATTTGICDCQKHSDDMMCCVTCAKELGIVMRICGRRISVTTYCTKRPYSQLTC
jgi:hypothetical protein